MTHKMPGQLNKPRKRKSNSEAKNSRKASSTRRKCMKGQKEHSAAESSVVSGYSKATGPLETLSRISCECQQTAGRRRCTASPLLGGQEGKENELKMVPDWDDCTLYGIWDKQEPEDMDYEETDKNIFPDDDSNQILPVEQFFGNLDVVQDFPQRSSVSSSQARRENRRRYYYAPDDSDEEEVDFSGEHQDDRAGT
ncbi:UPF0688 protein C1orf174 homolog [Scomber scombrus]|uniref:UPF0688 protein C1orf174 homolog n=1 Tax=Scomber scombrus TaxID=13677 RepID=A0AAV1N6Y3_SCOSC|nr:UPF0688 protein C1orf174 homolog [Scomber scombrus]